MELVTYPHPGLLKKTRPVETIDDPIRSAIRSMYDIMHSSNGVGLAAPQVAWSVRLLVMNPGDDRTADTVLINPVIKRKRGRVFGEEGCLSFPGIFVQVERAKEIDIEYQDGDGTQRRETRTDFEARIIQHEMDHLDNILLVHRMTPADRLKFKRELEAMARPG